MDEARGRFWRISSAGIFFQGGALAQAGSFAAVFAVSVAAAVLQFLTARRLRAMPSAYRER